MTLEEKISTINIPMITDVSSIGTLPVGAADTIEDFFVTFVKDRLPKEDVIKHWHNILMDYTSDLTRLSCCVRFGNNGSKKPSSKNETGYYKLRRGWLTKNVTDDFEYFFADNFFSSFVYKLALDGVKPSAEELGNVFRQHKFPYGFGFFIDNKVNEYKGVVLPVSKEPGFLGNYKLSHVFDAGECFNINGTKCGDAKLSEDYYPIGHSDDFLKNSDLIRRMDITDDAKEVIVAKFLRFAHPFNYFLTPTKKHHICGVPVYKKDIGEDPRMISYVRQYLKNTYPTEYDQFLKKILWYDDPKAVVATGKERIDITYGTNVISTGNTKSARYAAPKNVIDLTKINHAYLKKFKVGEIADQVLRAIIESGVNSGKITKADIHSFKTEKGKRKSQFMISRSLLSLVRHDSKGRPRYYKSPVVCYGEILYLYKDWDDSDLKTKDNLIQWIVNWITANGGKI